jgi:hypothetical protein
MLYTCGSVDCREQGASREERRDGEEVRLSAAVMDGLLLGRQRRRGIRLEKSRWHTPHHHSVQHILFFFSFPSLSLCCIVIHRKTTSGEKATNVGICVYYVYIARHTSATPTRSPLKRTGRQGSCRRPK